VTNRLPDRDVEIVTTVQRFRQITSGQILRLFFADNSPASRKARMTRTMARLHRWGHVSRIPRAVGGWSGGSDGYTYIPPTSRARISDPHTLDITELNVQLREAERAGECTLLAYDPEVFAHTTVGHLELKPDAYVRVRTPQGTFRYFVEVDRGTEWRHELAGKLRRYKQAFKQWDEPTFPLVLWSVPDEQRGRLLESVVKRSGEPDLFRVALADAVSKELVRDT
jgi:hypothetical protein